MLRGRAPIYWGRRAFNQFHTRSLALSPPWISIAPPHFVAAHSSQAQRKYAHTTTLQTEIQPPSSITQEPSESLSPSSHPDSHNQRERKPKLKSEVEVEDTLKELLYLYISEHHHSPETLLWSFNDLEPNPERQKALRNTLSILLSSSNSRDANADANGDVDMRFLRWRNALVPGLSLNESLQCLTYGLIPERSFFTNHKAGGEEKVVEIAVQNTPLWFLDMLAVEKLDHPSQIHCIISIIRQCPISSSSSPHRTNILATLVLFCIHNRVYSVLPALLRDLRSHPDARHISICGPILRALVTAPLVQGSIAGHSPIVPGATRRGRPTSSHVASPKPGLQTNLVGFSTYNELRMTVNALFSESDGRLDLETYQSLINASPPLPSDILRRINVPGRAPAQETTHQGRLSALARSLSAEGKPHETGVALDGVKRSVEKYSKLLPHSDHALAFPNQSPSSSMIPVSASLNKNAARAYEHHKDRTMQSTSEHETLTSLNALLLNAFKGDRRSRDPAHHPSALIAYFRRLQHHFNKQVHAHGNTGQETVEQETLHRGMTMAWNAFITSLAAQKGFPTPKLLFMLDTILNSTPHDSPSPSTAFSGLSLPSPPSIASHSSKPIPIELATLTAVINALVQRSEYESAVLIYKRFLASGRMGDLDWYAIRAGGLALAESGRFSESWVLLNEMFEKGEDVRGSLVRADRHNRRQRSVSSGFESESESGLGPQVFITSLMRTLAFKRRPDIVYALWDNMEAVYGVRPNAKTLNTILVTASSYSAPSEAVTLSEQLGWKLRRSSSPFGLVSTTSTPNDGVSRETFIQNIYGTLSSSKEMTTLTKRKDVGFWWGDKPAWQVARNIFRQVILGNWPELANVQPPVDVSDDPMKPLLDWKKRFRSQSPTTQSHNSSRRSSDLLPIPAPLGKYYDIIPDQRVFDAYIQLLCTHDLVHELPLTLTWARELGVIPSQRSLRLVFMHFESVGAVAPFDEWMNRRKGSESESESASEAQTNDSDSDSDSNSRLDCDSELPIQSRSGGGGGQQSPYAVLKRWLEEWIPRAIMPTEQEVENQRRSWTEKQRIRERSFNTVTATAPDSAAALASTSLSGSGSIKTRTMERLERERAQARAKWRSSRSDMRKRVQKKDEVRRKEANGWRKTEVW